jgi:DNA invertase Pin-like site-specific DNA recombinase
MMAKTPKFVSYLRVSTDAQGHSGLGLEAQREACRQHIAQVSDAVLVKEFIEIESGKHNDRAELAKAMSVTKAYGATLLIAKLDRLSRDAHFLIGLERSGVNFIACDNPQANRLTIGILALVAEQEREAISQRTKAALAAYKARGGKLGNPNGAKALREGYQRWIASDGYRGNPEATKGARDAADRFAAGVLPVISNLKAKGVTSAQGIARELNAGQVLTARGGKWSAASVINVMRRERC